MTTTIGDPLGHPGFARGEQEEESVGEERCDSDSDDDDDVDRYVFLARQPVAPAEARDDDDGAMPGGGGGGGGNCGRKRRPSGILAHAPPAAKKARLALAAPRAASAEESGSEEATRSPERFRGDLDQGKKNKKRRRCGGEPQVERAARGKDSKASKGSQHRHVMVGQKTSAAAAAGAAAEGAPCRRFLCSICGRGFGSYQALGGHVHRGHTKKAKDAASRGDVTGNGNEKAAVAASPGESDVFWKTTLRAAAACRQDADSSGGDSNSNEEQMFMEAANHRGHGNVDGEKGTEGKAAVRRCHELAAIGNGNSVVRKTQHRCGVCAKEFPSGMALGGHMKKHRKLSPHNDGAAGHGQEKTAVAAIPGVGESDCDGETTLRDAACRQDVDSCSGDSNSNEEMFIDAANHRRDCNMFGEKVASATSRDEDDGNGTERKAAVGRCQESDAIDNGNSAVRETQYRCGVCGQEYPSGKALGGHMKKHRKLSPHNGSKERRLPEVAYGAGHGREKTAMAASLGESDCDGKTTLRAACRRDVDSSSGDSNGNEDAANHHGDGNVDGEKVTSATSHDDDDGNGTEGKAAVGRCHEPVAIGNGNSAVREKQYRCGVCGQEYPSGKALGGHMRKHRKLSAHDGSKERRSPEVADAAGHGQEKTAVAVSPEDAIACQQDADSSSGNSNEEMFIGAAKHDDADGNLGNGIVSKAQYRCEVCGKEYLSGHALGGHMRMHRKNDGGKEQRSPEVDVIPDKRAAVITGNRQYTNTQYATPFNGSLIGWL